VCLPQLAQPTPLINSSSSYPKETVKEHVLKLDSEDFSKINMKCENQKYENLNVCF